MEVDRRIRAVWSGHPGFVHVGWEVDFQQKLARALGALAGMLTGR